VLKKHIRKRIIKAREIKNKNNLKVKFSLLREELKKKFLKIKLLEATIL